MAGIAGLKSLEIAPRNPSAKLLQDWIEGDTFVWLVTDEIISEYKRVLARLGVRRPLIGKIVNLLRDEAELVRTSALSRISPDPGDDPFCGCAEVGRAPSEWPLRLTLHLPDADSVWAKALAAACTVVLPIRDQFWGDSYGEVKHSFGFVWAMGNSIRQ